jgi:hypothetical protein
MILTYNGSVIENLWNAGECDESKLNHASICSFFVFLVLTEDHSNLWCPFLCTFCNVAWVLADIDLSLEFVFEKHKLTLDIVIVNRSFDPLVVVKNTPQASCSVCPHSDMMRLGRQECEQAGQESRVRQEVELVYPIDWGVAQKEEKIHH